MTFCRTAPRSITELAICYFSVALSSSSFETNLELGTWLDKTCQKKEKGEREWLVCYARVLTDCFISFIFFSFCVCRCVLTATSAKVPTTRYYCLHSHNAKSFIWLKCCLLFLLPALLQWGQGLCYTLTQNLDYDETWEPCRGRPTNK